MLANICWRQEITFAKVLYKKKSYVFCHSKNEILKEYTVCIYVYVYFITSTGWHTKLENLISSPFSSLNTFYLKVGSHHRYAAGHFVLDRSVQRPRYWRYVQYSCNWRIFRGITREYLKSLSYVHKPVRFRWTFFSNFCPRFLLYRLYYLYD